MIAQLDFDLPMTAGERAALERRRKALITEAVSNLSMLVDYSIEGARAVAADLLEDVNDHEWAAKLRGAT